MTTYAKDGSLLSTNNFHQCGWAGDYTFRCPHCGDEYRGGGPHVDVHHSGQCGIGKDYCKWCAPGKGCRLNDPDGPVRDCRVATHGWNR